MPGPDRRLIAVSVGALVVALVCGVAAVRAHPAVHRSTRTTVVPPTAISVDAFGCPRGRHCLAHVRPAALLAAAGEALPTARVDYAVQEADEQTGAVYRVVLRLAARDTTVRVVSQCVPGAAAVIGVPLHVSRVSGATLTPVLVDQPTPTGPKYWAITLAGSGPATAGCGVAVSAESALDRGIDGRAIDTVVNLLADDPRLMASP